MADYNMHVLVCGGTGCKASESELIKNNFKKYISELGLADEVQVITTGCFGFCEKGPIVKILPDNTFYTQVTPKDVWEIVEEHIVKGRKVKHLLYVDPKNDHLIPDASGMDFYKKQIRIALRNCGFINPENVEEYIARDGYAALGLCLSEKTPEEVIQIVKDSGFRAGVAAAVFQRGFEMGTYPQSSGRPKIRGLQTPTKATPVHLWTVPFWKATRIRLSKQWQFAVFVWAPTKGWFTFVLNIRWQSNV